MSETPIQKIGRYEIEHELGRGGMAIVYKAFDPRLERPVAIKLIKMSAFGEDSFDHVRERFEREAKALARLDHPNILKVHDFGEHNGAPYLVMDYIEGSTLKELKKPIRVDTAVRLLTPIADALEYVHAQGLLHRDVKPSNIMITQRGHVILTDFGIVKWLEDDGDLHTLTATGVGIGTPEYMSPEQGRGMQVDARSDMYSLSIVFYELITGRKPFIGDTPVNILLKQISEPLPDPRHLVPEISESVKKFLDRAAAKDPEDRYPTMKEYLLDFEGLRLQAQTNRAMGQTSNSGFQSLPRKTEATSSSLEIGKTGLAKVRAEVDTSSPQTAPAKRIPWGALTFAVVTLAVIIWGFFGLQNRGEKSAAQTQSAAQAAMMAATAESAKMTADAAKELAVIERKTATEAEARANATGTVGAERTAEQAAFDAHMVETARIETHEAAVAETQAAKTQSVIAMTETAEAKIVETQQAYALTVQAAEAKATRIAHAQTATQSAKYRVGDIIQFGRYEQDNNLSNGAEEIEWRILAIEGNTALIVSVMGLDAKPYHEPGGYITWEDSTLRSWLNNEFYNASFSEEERAKIKRTHIVNKDSPYHGTEGGNDTEDDIFLLSIAEAKKYFSGRDDRKMKPTKYAIANGAWTDSDNDNAYWWLRSPGHFKNYAAGVFSTGDIRDIGHNVSYAVDSVRPALRINLIAAQVPTTPDFAQEQASSISPDIKVGDIIQFGRYEQDNNLSNGAEEIEWHILAIEGNTALIVSVMGLDAKPYNEERKPITWKDCTLRSWLNNEFYNAAFNEAERAKIERTQVVNEDNPNYSTKGGNGTEDDIFLLSIAEVKQYFWDSEDRQLKPTKYAIANGAYENRSNGNGWWRLRSPGFDRSNAAEVDSDGGIDIDGDYVDTYADSVRPALRINLIAAQVPTTPDFAQEQEALISSNPKVGDIIGFGRYEQDNNLSNGAEEIEWRILAIEGNTALIVSVMGLDAKPYHEPGGYITWEDSTLRSWLNEDFYNEAFNEAERAKIERTHVVNEDNPKFSTDGGNDTEDDVFLLSIAEAIKYFSGRDDRKMKPTKYAIANGAWTNSDNGNGQWWLRSPGDNQAKSAEFGSYGGFISNGSSVSDSDDLVRPALRINLGK